jgi:hypothetical protein
MATVVVSTTPEEWQIIGHAIVLEIEHKKVLKFTAFEMK